MFSLFTWGECPSVTLPYKLHPGLSLFVSAVGIYWYICGIRSHSTTTSLCLIFLHAKQPTNVLLREGAYCKLTCLTAVKAKILD